MMQMSANSSCWSTFTERLLTCLGKSVTAPVLRDPSECLPGKKMAHKISMVLREAFLYLTLMQEGPVLHSALCKRFGFFLNSFLQFTFVCFLLPYCPLVATS